MIYGYEFRSTLGFHKYEYRCIDLEVYDTWIKCRSTSGFDNTMGVVESDPPRALGRCFVHT